MVNRYQGVIGVATGVRIGTGNENGPEVYTPGDDQLQLMPVFGPRVVPQYLVLWLCFEK